MFGTMTYGDRYQLLSKLFIKKPPENNCWKLHKAIGQDPQCQEIKQQGGTNANYSQLEVFVNQEVETCNEQKGKIKSTRYQQVIQHIKQEIREKIVRMSVITQVRKIVSDH